ncbi:MAG: hypothetical protein MR862_03620 [Clostridia bacterium]|nr:hypothetical protein [Clostridia bacterium]
MSENEKKVISQTQTLTLQNRNKLTLTGVTKVISVKDDLAQLETNMGVLQAYGKDIQLVSLELDKGEIELKGDFVSFKYGDKNSSFLKRLFK